MGWGPTAVQVESEQGWHIGVAAELEVGGSKVEDIGGLQQEPIAGATSQVLIISISVFIALSSPRLARAGARSILLRPHLG